MLIYLATVLLTSTVGLWPPLLIRQLIDKAIPRRDGLQIDLLVLAIVGLVTFGALVGVLRSYLSNLAGQDVVYDLRRRLYRHLTGMSLRWFTANRTGEVLSRVSNDVGSVQSVVSDTLGSRARQRRSPWPAPSSSCWRWTGAWPSSPSPSCPLFVCRRAVSATCSALCSARHRSRWRR